MNDKTFRSLIQLNKDFYDSVDAEFSRTRQSSWKGWGRVAKEIRKKFVGKKKISIIDLGCGNGRFYDFIREELNEFDLEYKGFDTSEYLIDEAINKYGNMFELHDVILEVNDLVSYNTHCDIVVAFGLTHHLPSSEFRKEWFNSASKLIKDNGLFVFTNWNYQIDSRFKKAVREVHTDRYDILESDIESGDYFLGFANEPQAYRYVHIYSEVEMSEILVGLGKKQMINYFEDGKNSQLNKYYLLS